MHCILLRMEVRTKCFNLLRTKFCYFLFLSAELLRMVIQNNTSHEYFDAFYLTWLTIKVALFRWPFTIL